ncbi:hypothetical protein [Microbulbifer sp.]|uniref:hypothetical protein n=1 Tax=Microbulbifer sp. TaxID=1908541 RepID=UPI003F2CF1EC
MAAPLDKVLARLDRVKPAGKSRWRAQCPVHDGHSLQVTEADDGKVLFKCWGCDAPAAEICRALGLELRDLFPYDPALRSIPSRPRLTAELREQLALDRWLGHICLYDLFLDRPVSDRDLDCAATAFNRLRRYRPHFFDEAARVHRLEVSR